MREDLIAYALGELNDDEAQRVAEAIADDPSLAEEYEQIRRCLEDVDCPDHEPAGDEIPTGLADRTTAGILSGCLNGSDVLPASDRHGFSATSCIMSPIDMTVAIGVLITIGCMLMPAVYQSRDHSQTIACTNNLRQLGVVLQQYSSNIGVGNGYFPVVRPTEHAGIFASRLREANIVRPDVLDSMLFCSGSPLAQQLAEQGKSFHVPSLAELSLSKGMLLLELQRTSTCGYGYQPGYTKFDYYLPAKNHGNNLVPVVSDAPSMISNNYATANHGGNVVNTLFQDGSVRSLPCPVVPCSQDELYFNHNGLPQASDLWNDAVILPSGATPGIEPRPMPEPVYRVFFHVR